MEAEVRALEEEDDSAEAETVEVEEVAEIAIVVVGLGIVDEAVHITTTDKVVNPKISKSLKMVVVVVPKAMMLPYSKEFLLQLRRLQHQKAHGVLVLLLLHLHLHHRNQHQNRRHNPSQKIVVLCLQRKTHWTHR